MKRILQINASKGYVRISTGPGAEPTPASPSAPPRRKVSLSSLTSTPARTVDDVRKAIAQGRFAELKPEQA
jgi:hypothetical protein